MDREPEQPLSSRRSLGIAIAAHRRFVDKFTPQSLDAVIVIAIVGWTPSSSQPLTPCCRAPLLPSSSHHWTPLSSLENTSLSSSFRHHRYRYCQLDAVTITIISWTPSLLSLSVGRCHHRYRHLDAITIAASLLPLDLSLGHCHLIIEPCHCWALNIAIASLDVIIVGHHLWTRSSADAREYLGHQTTITVIGHRRHCHLDIIIGRSHRCLELSGSYRVFEEEDISSKERITCYVIRISATLISHHSPSKRNSRG